MFTSNWYKLLSTKIFGGAPFEHPIEEGNYIKYTNMLGQSVISTKGPYFLELSHIMEQFCKGRFDGTRGVDFTDGAALDEEGPGENPLINDYRLRGNSFQNFTVGEPSIKWWINNNNGNAPDVANISATYTLTNNDVDSFTIREIGLYDTSTTGINTSCLLERTILDEPVTIEPNGVAVITYTISMPYPQ